MNITHKEEQREVDIDAIAEVIYTAIHGNGAWDEVKSRASRVGSKFLGVVKDTRLQAEHLLASSWLDEKLEDARQDGHNDGHLEGYNDGHLEGYNDGFREAQQVFS